MFRQLFGDRRGGIMVMYAYLFVFLLMPLSALCLDVSRYFYVRTHLQSVNDAACEAAAQALNVPTWQVSGFATIDLGIGRNWALREFNTGIRENALGTYEPQITGMALNGPRKVQSYAEASVPTIIPITPKMHPNVFSECEMRVSH